jgi:acetyl-CoA acetyltransferase
MSDPRPIVRTYGLLRRDPICLDDALVGIRRAAPRVGVSRLPTEYDSKLVSSRAPGMNSLHTKRGRANFLGRTAIVGVGFTPFTRASGESVLALATRATREALEDCGLAPGEVDGLVSYSLFSDSVPCQAVATALAIPELTYALDLNMGGQAPAFAVTNAAMAVASGLADVVVVFRALNGRSGIRVGSQSFAAPTAQYRYPIGFTAYAQYMALWARRFMIETGATADDFAAVVSRQREHAARNERAIRRTPLSIAEHHNAPWVVEPYRTVDCTIEVDGACAVVVTSTERARSLPHPPAVIQGAAWATGFGSGLDIADPHFWPDYSTNCQTVLADRLWESCGLTPRQIDVAQIYDCFSSTVLFGLEGLGFVGRGESGAFVRAGETALGGSLPVNTSGGLLCEGYLHGMNLVAEGALQIQGRCEERQVAGAESCAITSGGLGDGSALILTADG